MTPKQRMAAPRGAAGECVAVLVTCDKCRSHFEISDDMVGAEGRKLRCAFCQGVFWVKPPAHGRQEEEQEPDPALDGTMILGLFNKPKSAPPLDTPAHSHDDTVTRRESRTIIPQPPPEKGKGFRRIALPPGRKAQVLFKTGWFGEMPWEAVKAMSPYWELYQVPPGTVLFKPGDRNANLGLVASGLVRVYSVDQLGQRREITSLNKGHSLGELSFIDNKPRAAMAVAAQESYLFILSRNRGAQLAKDQPVVWQLLHQRLALLMCHRIRTSHGEKVDFLLY